MIVIDSVEAGSCDDVTATNLLLGLGTSGHWAQAGGCTPEVAAVTTAPPPHRDKVC